MTTDPSPLASAVARFARALARLLRRAARSLEKRYARPDEALVADREAGVVRERPSHRDAIEQICPRCESQEVHRSHARTMAERIRKEFAAERLFRCEACGWRGWLIPMEFGDHPPAEIPAPPNLDSLDRTNTPPVAAPRPDFSPDKLA